MKKSGFTISELVICLAIIGILSAAALTTFKKYEKGVKHIYSNTYYVLDRALYNATSFWISGDEKAREAFKEKVRNPENPDEEIEISDTEGARRLCRALIEYINPVESSNRDAICSAGKAISDMGTDDLFTAENVMFTATNGVRYWISKRYPTVGENGENAGELKFYIVYADLNGKQLPNTMRYVPGTEANNWNAEYPDIFAFAALENGRVCPLGPPEVDPYFLTTRVVYQEVDENNEIEFKYSEPSMPYYYSKAEAWGYYLPENRRPDGENELKDDDVINDEPLSFNGYVRNKLHDGSIIYEFLGDKTMSQYVLDDPLNYDENGNFTIIFQSDPPRHRNGNRNLPNIGGFGCSWASEEECYVLIDKYLD